MYTVFAGRKNNVGWFFPTLFPHKEILR